MVDIPNGLWPESNILVGGQPDDAAFRAAQDAGFKTIINLRGVGEPGTEQQPGLMDTLGFTYHHLPINGPQSINLEAAKTLAGLIEGAERPLMIHCASGNRVGALFALIAHGVSGKDADESMQVGLSAGLTGLAPFVRSLLVDRN